MVGKIQEFDVKSGNWTGYCERLDMYFVANKVEDELKLPTLIAVIGEDAYLLLSTLASPKLPSKLTYAEAVALLKNHLQPKPSVLAQRYMFRKRRQEETESIVEFMAALKKLAQTCDFGAALEENLRDQLVCGITSESTRQRLFAEDDTIEYKKALRLAIGLEAAEKNAGAVDQVQANVNKMGEMSMGFKCLVCGDAHGYKSCKYKHFECSLCKRIGHLRRMCPEKLKAGDQQPRGDRGASETSGYSGGSRQGWRATSARGRGRGYSGGGRGYSGGGRSHHNYWVQDQWPAESTPGSSGGCAAVRVQAGDPEEESEDDDEEPIYQMSLSKYKPT